MKGDKGELVSGASVCPDSVFIKIFLKTSEFELAESFSLVCRVQQDRRQFTFNAVTTKNIQQKKRFIKHSW